MKNRCDMPSAKGKLNILKELRFGNKYIRFFKFSSAASHPEPLYSTCTLLSLKMAATFFNCGASLRKVCVTEMEHLPGIPWLQYFCRCV